MATRIGKRGAGPRDERVVGEQALRRYHAGEPLPCPVGCGGLAEVVRVSTTAAGAGDLWVECASCAQRRRYEVAPATTTERRRVSVRLSSGREAVCPRDTGSVLLQRRGRQLVCPRCGVLYRG